MIKIKITFIFICLITFNVFSQQHDIDTSNIKFHLSILGSDLFAGRGTGTKGGELAANYISKEFSNYGLTSVCDNELYFQNVPLHGVSYFNEAKLNFCDISSECELSVNKDFIFLTTGEQTIIPKPTELIFVNYGIIAPEYDYNDYQDKDVIGKIVVMLEGEPESNIYNYFNGNEPTLYSYPNVKHRIAISRGALGTIIIPNWENYSQQRWESLIKEYAFEDIKLSYQPANNFGVIINPKTVQRNFGIKQINLEELSKIDFSQYNIQFDGEFFTRDFKSPNVIGLIEGRKIDEFLILSAHYDHLGIGPIVNGDEIYNGVLDNALGVSTLLEITRLLKLNQNLLERSILVIATTGEEKGLLGSTYYTDHPIVPLYKTVANINIDGVAFIDKFKSVVAIGGELSNLGEILEEVAERNKLTVGDLPFEFYTHESFNRSDQIAFAKSGIPSILVLDLPEYEHISREEAINKIIQYNSEIYHTPFDDLNIPINFNAVHQHAKLLYNFILDISNNDEDIEWNNNSPYNFIRLQTIAEER